MIYIEHKLCERIDAQRKLFYGFISYGAPAQRECYYKGMTDIAVKLLGMKKKTILVIS